MFPEWLSLPSRYIFSNFRYEFILLLNIMWKGGHIWSAASEAESLQILYKAFLCLNENNKLK